MIVHRFLIVAAISLAIVGPMSIGLASLAETHKVLAVLLFVPFILVGTWIVVGIQTLASNWIWDEEDD